jgi:hypothetical protein
VQVKTISVNPIAAIHVGMGFACVHSLHCRIPGFRIKM